jgi:alcohol dehydrogenase YqhD (iron-dependent ADH family)
MADIKAAADEGLRSFRCWVKSIGMPLTLKELGIPREDLPQLIRRCLDSNGGTVKGYMELDNAAVTAIFTSIVE